MSWMNVNGCVIESVSTSHATSIYRVWMCTTIAICRKTWQDFHADFHFALVTGTKHTCRPFQSLGDTKRHLLIPFPCSSCTSSSFTHNDSHTRSPMQFQRRPPRSLQVPTKSPTCAENPWNFSSLPCLISYLSADNVKRQWLGGHCPSLSLLR